MIRLLLTFMLIFVGINADTNSTNRAVVEGSNIVSVVNAIRKINNQIDIIKTDVNATDSLSLNTLNTQKTRFLAQIPVAIMAIDITAPEIEKFRKDKERLEKNVARYASNKAGKNYITNAIELENFILDERFYTCIIELEEMFKKGKKAAAIKTLLENTIVELRTSKFEHLSQASEETQASYKKEIDELKVSKRTADEILVYLKDNADLLSASFAVNDLNINSVIEKINEKIPYEGVNVGKIVVIVLIFAFFLSLTRVLAKLTYWLTLSLFVKNVHAETIKEQILNIIKRPISSLLIAYALRICISVAYYPAPMPLSTANGFVIAYIVLTTWLIITILNGYGMLLIGEVAKKSGRKEVVNLIIKIVNFIVILIAILLVLSRLGFDISAIIASLGIGGLAVAFAAKDIIANFFASVMLLLDNSFSQGDLIVCGSIEGTIVEIGIRKTTIRSADNALIFVPNLTLSEQAIINWSRRKAGRIINITVALTYSSKPDQLRQCIDDIKEMLNTHKDVSRTDNGGEFSASHRLKFHNNIVSINDLAGYKNAIYVSLDNLNDSSIDIAITCFTKVVTKAEYIQVKQDILFKIMDIVAKNGLEFAFPSQSLYIQNPDKSDFTI